MTILDIANLIKEAPSIILATFSCTITAKQ